MTHHLRVTPLLPKTLSSSIAARDLRPTEDLQFPRRGPTIEATTQSPRDVGASGGTAQEVLAPMHDLSSGPKSRKLVKTSTPGVYRRGNRYVVVFRDPTGRQHKRAARTLAEARELKASLTTDVNRGEYRTASKATFADHWSQWIDNYSGRTTRGFRESTRAEYRRDLEKDALPFFGRIKLAEIEPQHIKQWLTNLSNRGLSASTIRSILAPVRAMLADASEDGLIRHNPAAGVRVPSSAKTTEPKVKALTIAEVERLRGAIRNESDLLLVDFMLVTGLRISEVIALDFGDVDLGRCVVKVTKRFYKGVDVPKSSFGRREVPITPEIGQRLWAQRKSRADSTDSDPLFVSPNGARLDYANTYNRLLRPAMRKAGIPWGGAHRLRHTAATHLIRSGASANQAQLWLGHHDPGFTARTYVHLEGSDLPDPSIFDSLLSPRAGETPTESGDMSQVSIAQSA